MVVVVGMKLEWSGLVALAKDVVVTPLGTGVNLAVSNRLQKQHISAQLNQEWSNPHHHVP